MTPARKSALQWFHEMAEKDWMRYPKSKPTENMISRMVYDMQIYRYGSKYALTDAGRRAIHGDLK